MKQQIAIIEPEGLMFFGIADTMYRQIDRLAHYKVPIISFRYVPIIDLSGAFALEDMVMMAGKRKTKVILKGMNPAVRRTLTELKVLETIGEENIAQDIDGALKKSLDYLADRFLESTDVDGPRKDN